MSASIRYFTLLALSLSAALAQVSTGTIVGVVADSTGAVIANADVTLRHTATGEVRETRTNQHGEFSAPFVRVGGYSLTVAAQGFKTETVSGIVLLVDQTVNLRVTLEVGALSERIEVTGAAPLVDSATSSLGQVIVNQQILDMPLNGRNPFALGLLSGNTTPMFGMGSNLPFIAGGGRFSANEVTLDGVDNNTVSNAGAIGRNGIAFVPSVDAYRSSRSRPITFRRNSVMRRVRSSMPPSRTALISITGRHSSFCGITIWTPITSSPIPPASPGRPFTRTSSAARWAAPSSTTRPSSLPIIRVPAKRHRREVRSPTCRRPLCGPVISPESRRRSTIPGPAASGRLDL